MPEALTESFCERCGTRYEFAPPPKLSALRKTRGLVSGFKNYIMSQDALSDTIDDAMRSEEEILASHQLEAFHSAFNFCINCRQYACTNCWNETAGRCRTCAPIPGVDDLDDRMEAAYLADHRAMHGDAVLEGLQSDEIARRLVVDAWPESDLAGVEATNGHVPVEWPAEPISPATSRPEPEPIVAETVPDATYAVREPEPAAASAEPASEPTTGEPELHPILAWEGDADIRMIPTAAEAEPELEPEPVVAEAEPEPEPEPVVAEAQPEPEPEPVVAAAEPELEPMPLPLPTPIRPPQKIRPISETIIHIPRTQPISPAPQATPIDEEALAARRAQLDVLGIEDPGMGNVGPARNVVPYRSSGAAVGPSELLQRTLGGPTALWDASAREVASARSAVAIQNCGSCGLSLSASARFCRRCGTRQARSA